MLVSDGILTGLWVSYEPDAFASRDQMRTEYLQ